jgi:hypothetical protein
MDTSGERLLGAAEAAGIAMSMIVQAVRMAFVKARFLPMGDVRSAMTSVVGADRAPSEACRAAQSGLHERREGFRRGKCGYGCYTMMRQGVTVTALALPWRFPQQGLPTICAR